MDYNNMKRHVEKQVSWTLLLKASNIFDKVDTNRSGQMEYDEFKQFGMMLHLNEKETETLWHTIDTDNSGQITIVKLFDWFKKRLEAAQSKNKTKSEPAEFSRSHSSFFSDDDSTESRSISAAKTEEKDNLNDEN